MSTGVFRRPFRLPAPSQSLLGALSFTGAPVNADADITEGNDTLSAEATLELQASLNTTEGDDFATAAGSLLVAASAFITEGDDTSASDATLEIRATAAISEGDDVPSSFGTVDIVASLFATEGNDTLSADAQLRISALALITESDDTLSATAQMPVFFPRRGGADERQELWRKELEWEHDLKRIIDQAWLIAHGLIDPVTLEPIPPPDLNGLASALEMLHRTLEQENIDAFVAEDARRQEEEAIALLLLAA